MFEESSVFVLLKDDNIKKLELEKNIQTSICATMSNATSDLLDKEQIEFDGSYKPHEDECLFIREFKLLDGIKDAIRNPIGVESFNPHRDEIEDIKAIFVGSCRGADDKEVFDAAFQKFKKEQHIQPKWYNLFYSKGTFIQENKKCISVSDTVDCIFIDNSLRFVSFYYAKQIFALNEYYRIATDKEVEKFATHEKLLVENPDGFKQLANTWVRRKIAMINDSNVLNDNSIEKILNTAKRINISIEIRDKKLVLPNNKETLKYILGFLDEEVYQGHFSQNTYLANSKRRICS